MALYRRLLGLIKPYRTKVIFAAVCMIFYSLFYAAQAYLVKDVVNKVFIDKDEKCSSSFPSLSSSFSSSKEFSITANLT